MGRPSSGGSHRGGVKAYHAIERLAEKSSEATMVQEWTYPQVGRNSITTPSALRVVACWISRIVFLFRSIAVWCGPSPGSYVSAVRCAIFSISSFSYCRELQGLSVRRE